ncbi:hypothetical protein SLS62_000530 [Diatrype stigma]|uniref:Uncharacterized protein n=1 Tax=Diatrype stigma TaxID=117547 RepID=A0AAN9UXS2_9PEZI
MVVERHRLLTILMAPGYRRHILHWGCFRIRLLDLYLERHREHHQGLYRVRCQEHLRGYHQGLYRCLGLYQESHQGCHQDLCLDLYQFRDLCLGLCLERHQGLYREILQEYHQGLCRDLYLEHRQGCYQEHHRDCYRYLCRD